MARRQCEGLYPVRIRLSSGEAVFINMRFLDPAYKELVASQVYCMDDGTFDAERSLFDHGRVGPFSVEYVEFAYCRFIRLRAGYEPAEVRLFDQFHGRHVHRENAVLLDAFTGIAGMV